MSKRWMISVARRLRRTWPISRLANEATAVNYLTVNGGVNPKLSTVMPCIGTGSLQLPNSDVQPFASCASSPFGAALLIQRLGRVGKRERTVSFFLQPHQHGFSSYFPFVPPAGDVP